MKLIASMFAAALLALGLMTVASPAQAAYPKSISTSCAATIAKSTIKTPTRPRLAFSARPTAGNGTPKGTVTVKFVKNGVVKRTATRSYAGGVAVFSFKPLRAGDYSIKASLNTGASSVFKNCSDGSAVHVRR